MMYEGRIRTDVEYGAHIDLMCVNHPDLRWSTKNIGHIGARSIFWMPPRPYDGTEECTCSVNDLLPVITA
jgi:hypothetical protein